MAGLLEQILGGVTGGGLGRGVGGRGGGGHSAAMNGVLVAMAAKAAQNYMRQRGGERSFDPGQRGAATGGGGLGDAGPGLPGGLGGLLGGLGGAGALGALLGQLRERGLGQEVDSWIRPGPNQAVPPQRLAEALGDDTVDSLASETGVPRQTLLSELSQTLPEAVDELTPEGHEPSDDDLDRLGRA